GRPSQNAGAHLEDLTIGARPRAETGGSHSPINYVRSRDGVRSRSNADAGTEPGKSPGAIAPYGDIQPAIYAQERLLAEVQRHVEEAIAHGHCRIGHRPGDDDAIGLDLKNRELKIIQAIRGAAIHVQPSLVVEDGALGMDGAGPASGQDANKEISKFTHNKILFRQAMMAQVQRSQSGTHLGLRDNL